MGMMEGKEIQVTPRQKEKNNPSSFYLVSAHILTYYHL